MQRVTETVVVARKPRGGNDVNASLVTALKAPPPPPPQCATVSKHVAATKCCTLFGRVTQMHRSLARTCDAGTRQPARISC